MNANHVRNVKDVITKEEIIQMTFRFVVHAAVKWNKRYQVVLNQILNLSIVKEDAIKEKII